MGDRTEEEQERFLREHSRRMKICPQRLGEKLRPQGFDLVLADRSDGLNKLQFVRPTPDLNGLYDHLSVAAGIDGEYATARVWTAITPSDYHISYIESAFADVVPEYTLLDCRTVKAARAAESFIADGVESLLEAILDDATHLHEVTAGARAAVDRYLSEVRPSNDLNETLERLGKRASRKQLEHADQYITTQYLSTFNLEEFRVVWKIGQLAQVMFWEHEQSDLIGPNTADSFSKSGAQPTEMQLEANRRLQIFASRLAFEPGWPMVDELVPRRFDVLEDPAPWRDFKLDAVGNALDEYLSAADMRCSCARLWCYGGHSLTEKETIDVQVGCANAHRSRITLSLSALRQA